MAFLENLESNLRLRLITGITLSVVSALVLILSSYTCTGKWLLLSFVFIALGLTFGEFSRICWHDRKSFLQPVIYFLSPFIGILSMLINISSSGFCSLPETETFISNTMAGLGGIIIGFFLASWYMIASARNSIDQSQTISSDLFLGILFLGLGGVAAVSLAMHQIGYKLLLWIILVVASGDSIAYFVGSKLKGPKLSPIISPAKTWSGASGGILAGALVGSLSANLIALSLIEGIFIGAVVQLVAQLGDLLKSYIKRVHGVKDSGTILPGHGGVLDRIDGMLAAAILFRFVLMPMYLGNLF